MISRDGAQTSLWQETAFERNSPLNSQINKRYDVVIVGGGITGITTALELANSGKNCIVLETHNLCYGTTGGTTAHLNTLLDTPYTVIAKNFGIEKATAIAEATFNALEHIKLNIRIHSIDCGFEESQAFLYAVNEEQAKELTEIHDMCEDVGLETRYSETIPVPVPFTKAMAVSGQGKFHPVRYVMGLAAAFENKGGHIMEHCRVTGIKEEDNIIKVESDQGIIECTNVIYATHIPPEINLLHLRCAPYRSYAMAVRLTSERYPKDLSYDMEDPYHYHRTQVIDGQSYLIVGGKDHKTGKETNTDACFRQLESYVRHHYDTDTITHRWSSQYYEPADGIPYIGTLPGHSENVLVATGYGGNGMTYSTIAARVLKSIILKQADNLIDIFAPSRVKPVAGFKNFTKHNFGVLKELISKLTSNGSIHGLADLAPGEGKVVSIDGQSVGIYKDENGSVHTVNAACTHMKCTVSWNLAEKSWDCPCHGARYSMDGEVLNGPASRDLEYINLELVDATQT